MKSATTNSKGRFGSFSGVFTPNVLTILGIILFLRTGWVVGHAGLTGALIIIGISNLISLFTGLSLSSVATNMKVKTGGAYYMISRTFGLEIGGAIGIPLYISQAISVAFYIIGFTEALTSVFPVADPVILSILLTFFFSFLAYMGADFILKIQFIIIGILCASLASFFLGGFDHWVTPQFSPIAGSEVKFWHVFAVFFPAVTGIMVGASMSGDLKEPEKSIPKGTISAILVTAAIYFATAIWLSLHATPQELMSDNLVMQKISRWPFLILLGVWVSTLSSALGSIMAAPRTLQALSFDHVVPKFIGHQMGSKTEPRVAVIITAFIAISIILIGDLNFVAPIITMFFLNTYGMINISAGMERLVGNPSFRPRFKVPWYISLAGGFFCYGTMLLINITATIIAILISLGIYFYLRKRSLNLQWGNITSGFWFSIIRLGLYWLNRLPQDRKNWRPNIIVFSGASGTKTSRPHLKEIGEWLAKGQGIITLHHLLVGNVEELTSRGFRKTSRDSLVDHIKSKGVVAFAECSIVSDFYKGVIYTIQAHGFRGIEPNTALLGWSQKEEIQKEQMLLMRHLFALHKSVLFLHFNENRGFGRKKRIDIWWRGLDQNAELMLILSHIISQDDSWENVEIRVLRLIENEEGKLDTEKHIDALLKKFRVDAKAVVLVKKFPEQTFQMIAQASWHHTDLVFLGLAVPEPEDIEARTRFLRNLLNDAPATILVRSAETGEILDSDKELSTPQ